MVEGAQVDFDTALRIESRYLAKLIVTRAKNMINTFFFNMNAISPGNRVRRGREVQAAKSRHPGRRHDGAGIAYVQASRRVATVLKT